jgi:hypothetical protein
LRIFNSEYDFDRDAPPDAKMAFSSRPSRTLFAPNHDFFRFVTPENSKTGVSGNNTFASPWWFTKQALKRILQRSDPRYLGPGAVARIRLAVTPAMNPEMSWICSICLTSAAYAWVGKASRQPVKPGSHIYFGGGEEQVFLPNLVPNEQALSSDYARMRSFVICTDF